MALKDNSQQVKRKDTKKFTWRIENFSKLTEAKVCSDNFLVGDHKWRVSVYPKGNYQKDVLSIYLDLADKEALPFGWSVTADYSLRLVDQLNNGSSIGNESTAREFRKDGTGWGWRSFAPLNTLCSKGIIVDDTVVIEAQVSTEFSASESAATDESKDSLTEPLSPDIQGIDNPDKANGNSRRSSFSPSTVQLNTQNLISELSNMTSSCNSDGNSSSHPGHSSGLLQQQREKLCGLFDKSLESLHQTKSLAEVEDIAGEILALATDPLQKTVLKDLILRLTEFKETVPSSLSTIETSLAIETTKAEMTKDLEQRLAHRKGQLTSLEAEVSRLKGEGSKLDVEIQQLTSRKAKIMKHVNTTEVELEKANQEASNELDELKKEHQERKEACEKRMRAMEKLAQANASWKLFKNLGW